MKVELHDWGMASVIKELEIVERSPILRYRVHDESATMFSASDLQVWAHDPGAAIRNGVNDDTSVWIWKDDDNLMAGKYPIKSMKYDHQREILHISAFDPLFKARSIAAGDVLPPLIGDHAWVWLWEAFAELGLVWWAPQGTEDYLREYDIDTETDLANMTLWEFIDQLTSILGVRAVSRAFVSIDHPGVYLLRFSDLPFLKEGDSVPVLEESGIFKGPHDEGYGNQSKWRGVRVTVPGTAIEKTAGDTEDMIGDGKRVLEISAPLIDDMTHATKTKEDMAQDCADAWWDWLDIIPPTKRITVNSIDLKFLDKVKIFLDETVSNYMIAGAAVHVTTGTTDLRVRTVSIV